MEGTRAERKAVSDMANESSTEKIIQLLEGQLAVAHNRVPVKY
ncbi:hypothetical protein ACFPRA_21890 [Sporosarcina soli]|uniref:Uncharacterized protein n=1 Tax=Sporosarcina soli TaxID=334736 RepID=A0ABW0TQ17_9BACL